MLNAMDIETTFKLVDGELHWVYPNGHRNERPRIHTHRRGDNYIFGRGGKYFRLKDVMKVLNSQRKGE